ncbi:hypothetical protein OROMI_014665 [Orobanche minor]
MPQRLWELYTSLEFSHAVHFRRHCRTYINTAAFSSLGIRYDETLVKSNKGIYTLRIQGAVYHFIRDLLPAEGHGRQLQLYFCEPENELQNRLSQSGDLDVHILEDIIDLMKLNPYAMFFRGLRELVNLEEYNIVLLADPSLDMRIYNLPTVNQVAAIWNETTNVPAVQSHDIRVYASSGKTHCVHYNYGCYVPLQYPLLFPYGESGWLTGIRRVSLIYAATDARSRKQCSGQEVVYPRSHLSGEPILTAELGNLATNKWKHNNIFSPNNLLTCWNLLSIFARFVVFSHPFRLRLLESTAAIIIDSHPPRIVTAKGKENTLHEYAAVDELGIL